MGAEKKEEEHEYEVGKLYRFDGEQFIEVPKSEVVKLPITDDALEAVQRVRKKVQQVIGLRPELSVVASAMLLQAEQVAHIEDAVRTLGAALYQVKERVVQSPDGDGPPPR